MHFFVLTAVFFMVPLAQEPQDRGAMSPETLRHEIDARLLYEARQTDCRFHPSPRNHQQDGSICCERCEPFIKTLSHDALDGCALCYDKNQSWMRFNLQFAQDYPGTYAANEAWLIVSFLAPDREQKIEAFEMVVDFYERSWPFTREVRENRLVRKDEYKKESPQYPARTLAQFYVYEERYQEAEAVLERVLKLELSESDRRILKKELDAIPAQANLKPGMMAPNFRGTGLDGERIDLEELRGKVVLLDFWATWCGPCKRVTSKIVGLYDMFDRSELEVIGISLDDPEMTDQIKAFTEKHEMRWLQIYEGLRWDQPIVKQYAVTSIPSTFLIDQEGRLVTITGGLENSIRRLLEQTK